MQNSLAKPTTLCNVPLYNSVVLNKRRSAAQSSTVSTKVNRKADLRVTPLKTCVALSWPRYRSDDSTTCITDAEDKEKLRWQPLLGLGRPPPADSYSTGKPLEGCSGAESSTHQVPQHAKTFRLLDLHERIVVAQRDIAGSADHRAVSPGCQRLAFRGGVQVRLR